MFIGGTGRLGWIGGCGLCVCAFVLWMDGWMDGWVVMSSDVVETGFFEEGRHGPFLGSSWDLGVVAFFLKFLFAQ